MTYSFVDHRASGPVAMTEDDPYWEGLEDGVLRLPKCPGCGVWRWESIGGIFGSPIIRCGECGSWDLDWQDQPLEGVVYSWGRTHQVFYGVEGRAEQVPYATLNVEVGGPGGPRVLGVLQGSGEKLRVGAKVKGSIERPSKVSNWYAGLYWTVTD